MILEIIDQGDFLYSVECYNLIMISVISFLFFKLILNMNDINLVDNLKNNQLKIKINHEININPLVEVIVLVFFKLFFSEKSKCISN